MVDRSEMSYSAWFESVGGTGRRFPLNEVIYRDPDSGSLLEVVHERAPVAVPGLSGWSAGWLAASGILLGFAVLGARRVMPRG